MKLALATSAENFTALNDNAPEGRDAVFFQPRRGFQTYAAHDSFSHSAATRPWPDDMRAEAHESVHAWGCKVRGDYSKPMKQPRHTAKTAFATLRKSLSIFSIAYVSSALALAFVLHLGLEHIVH